jgi:hypothetical protein
VDPMVAQDERLLRREEAVLKQPHDVAIWLL